VFKVARATWTTCGSDKEGCEKHHGIQGLFDRNKKMEYLHYVEPLKSRPNHIPTSPRRRLGTTTSGRSQRWWSVTSGEATCRSLQTPVATKMALRSRASPSSDARRLGPSDAIRTQGLPSHGRRVLKSNLVRLRIGSLNIGTLTGRSRELSDALKRRRIDIACVQEVKWQVVARP